jgi:hypothetical protein
MKKRIALVVTMLGAIFAFAGSAVAAPPPPTPCTDNSYASKTTTKNFDVPAGATCDLSWATINGNVTVEGSLVTFGTTTFNGNVTVTGGSFDASNWGVKINGNLIITDPAESTQSGFYGNQGGTSSEITGNLTYTITHDYPQYHQPSLYFGGGTKIDGNFTYNTGGRIGPPGWGYITAPDPTGLTVVKNTYIS